MSSNSQRAGSRPQAQRQQSNSFRFIDQSSGSITSEQRQAIRSAVMVRIRSEEQRAGIRRSGSRRTSPPESQRTSGGQSREQTSSEEREPFHYMIQELHEFQLPNTPSLLRENPFDLAMQSESHTVNVVGELMNTCFRRYLPYTFPTFGSDDLENEKRQKNILSSKRDRLATFFGILSIVAAHQTIVSEPSLDLDPLTHDSDDRALNTRFSSMNLMKHHALSSINETINQMVNSDQDPDEHVIEAVFLLIGGALAIGNTAEARIHFDHMRNSMQTAADFDHTSISSSPWVPLYDLAYAATMGSRPLFDLPWDEDDVHEYLKDRVPVPHDHELDRMGKGFVQISRNFSQELKNIVLQGRQVALLCEYGKVSHRLSSSEHAQLYQKILQLQYDIVMYLYGEDEEQVNSSIPPVDRVICLAILALISRTMIRVVPSSGQGRQMTHLQHAALQQWLRTISKSRREFQLMLWASLLFRQCSADNEKSELFEELLRRVVKELDVNSWSQTETVLHEFLYMPNIQEDGLQKVLRKAIQG